MREITPEQQEAIRLGYARRDRERMAPTIAYFEQLLASDPEHPVLVFELAGAFDTGGEQARAVALYEHALELGLEGDPLRRCLCQYGSTLRWQGRLEQSAAVLQRARREFPESDAVRVFLGLTLNEAGHGDAATAELLAVIAAHGDATDLGHYATGLGQLARWLRDGRPDG